MSAPQAHPDGVGTTVDDPPLVYRPKRRARLVCAALFLGIGLPVLGLQEWLFRHAVSVVGGPDPALRPGSWFLTALGLVLLAAVLRDSPRLTIRPDGLTLRTLFRTTTVPWERLGPFTLVVANKGKRRERLLSARAPVTPEAGGRVRRFVLANAFTMPLPAILEVVARHHRGIPTGTAAVIDPPARPIGIPGFRFPWMTLALLLLLVGVFVLEQRLALTPPGRDLAPSLDTLLALGGIDWSMIRAGQWYRLICGPLLHASLTHLIGNAIALALAGYGLERLVGRAWMVAVFTTGALAGAGMSMLVSPPAAVSVGASGGIMAMLAALFVVGFRVPPGCLRNWVLSQSARTAVPALLPLNRGTAALHVDYGAHLGGALLGLAVGALLVLTWRKDAPLPRFRTPALVLSLLAAFCAAAAGVGVANGYGAALAAEADRIPLAELPHTLAELLSSASRLVVAYPHDPIAHFYDGLALMQHGDAAGAERQLRTALSLAGPMRTMPAMVSNMRGTLALVLLDEAHRSEAQDVARAVCTAGGGAAPTPQIMAHLHEGHLCDSDGMR